MAKRSDESLLALPELDKEFMESIGETAQLSNVKKLFKEASLLISGNRRLKEIREELKVILNGSDGVRYGNQCCIISTRAGRKSIQRKLLIENGVTPQQIEDSTVTGDDYVQIELPVIGENNDEE